VRLLGVGIGSLSQLHQLSLWDESGEADNINQRPPAPDPVNRQKQQSLRRAIEELEQRYGDAIVQRGCIPDEW
jgi:hypothetical protein